MLRSDGGPFSRSPDTRANTLGNDINMEQNIPACAMYRQIGTVIVKTDRDCSRTCDSRLTCDTCEQCRRTTRNSQYSDCDSDIVKRCRTYRSSAARSRYVNVCAAVCLLLLVGGLSPQSSAAPPHKRDVMEDQRSSDEDFLWDNPCHYRKEDRLPSGLPKSKPEFKASTAKVVANQARTALSTAQGFKDIFSKNLFGYGVFETLAHHWDSTSWLHSEKYDPLVGSAFPREKTVVGQPMPEDVVKKALDNIDDVLPSVHVTLKLVVAAMYDIQNRGFDFQLDTETALKDPFISLMNQCSQTLCYFNDLMASRGLEVVELPKESLPDARSGNRLENLVITFRDSMLFLDWVTQLMDGLAAASQP